MALDDRREVPAKHKEGEEQTNQDNNLDYCVCHFVRPHEANIYEEFELLLPFLQTLLRGKVSSNFRFSFALKGDLLKTFTFINVCKINLRSCPDSTLRYVVLPFFLTIFFYFLRLCFYV